MTLFALLLLFFLVTLPLELAMDFRVLRSIARYRRIKDVEQTRTVLARTRNELVRLVQNDEIDISDPDAKKLYVTTSVLLRNPARYRDLAGLLLRESSSDPGATAPDGSRAMTRLGLLFYLAVIHLIFQHHPLARVIARRSEAIRDILKLHLMLLDEQHLPDSRVFELKNRAEGLPKHWFFSRTKFAAEFELARKMSRELLKLDRASGKPALAAT